MRPPRNWNGDSGAATLITHEIAKSTAMAKFTSENAMRAMGYEPVTG